MTFTEALIEAQRTNSWFRPVGWDGNMSAYRVHFGTVHYLETEDEEGTPHLNFCVDTLTSEWEVVSPETVMKGE
jgi:hypothetical protein